MGLGAGLGVAERNLATRLGLKENEITLVDKKAETISGFKGKYIVSDIFDFLKQGGGKKYGFVTVFGLEYILEDKKKWNSLWDGLKNVTSTGAIIVVYPNTANFNLPDKHYEVKEGPEVLIAKRIS